MTEPTVAQLRARLANLGVAAPARARRSDLAALVAAAETGPRPVERVTPGLQESPGTAPRRAAEPIRAPDSPPLGNAPNHPSYPPSTREDPTMTDTAIPVAEIVEPVPEHEPTTAAVVHVPAASALVEPVADLDTIARAYENYEAVCARLLKDSDYQEFGQAGKRRRFVKKSGWRKLAVAMGVSVELLSIDSERDENGRTIRTTVIARATAPNGRSMDGVGICSVDEQRFGGDVGLRTDHDIPATAMTRATNRACADLFGFGAVSAEEMQGGGGGGYGGEYDEPMENVHRSSSSSTAPPVASEKQVKMLRARLSEALALHELPHDAPYRPLGWSDAGLPAKAKDVLKGRVDDALKLIATAAETGDFEPIAPEAPSEDAPDGTEPM